jgi:putative sugar O-methyltransferase
MDSLPKRAINKVIREINFQYGIWSKSKEFVQDKNYNLNLVSKGFADRKEEITDDFLILDRICTAYIKAKEVQRQVSHVYAPSNEWLPIYTKYLQGVMEALNKRDLNTLSRIYGNFWRDPCSTGLVGLTFNMEKYYFGKRINRRHKMLYMNDVIHRYRLWYSYLGNTHTIEDLDSPIIGNPYGFYINDRFIKAGSDYLHYYATAIGRLLKTGIAKCVVELGAGYGGMAYYLLRDNKNAAYIDLDLPENSALTAYYLLKSFPEREIRLFGEIDSMQESIDANEILILPSFEVGNLPNDSAGIVFNSYSLAEMSRETIDTLVPEFTRLICSSGYFMHVNHNKKSLVVADDFGVNPTIFDLLYKIPALWNMGVNSHMDEFEYLYKKHDAKY